MPLNNEYRKIGLYRTDSFLVAKIDRFNYLGEHPGSAGGEIDCLINTH